MKIIDYFKSEQQAHWLEQIGQCEWRAAKYLAQILTDGTFHQLLGRGTLYLLTDGAALASFLTLCQRDCIEDAALYPWIGFVHTAPAYRGQRHAGTLIDHAVRIAGLHGAENVYICTDHVGLYEKYGFTYLEDRVSIYGEKSRVLVRKPKAKPLLVEALSGKNFSPSSLDGFIRHQEVRECWRLQDGQWQLVPAAFTEEWNQEKLHREAADILAGIEKGEEAFAAFDGKQVVGYVKLGGVLGSHRQYIELVSFHVSEPYRGMGVGRRLFEAACDAARAAGAEKLYISAHSSRESQAAYRALGCVHAVEVDRAHSKAEPFDVQMEYDLRRRLHG